MSARVLLVDEHPIVRSGVRALLDSELDLKVVGEGVAGTDAIRQARQPILSKHGLESRTAAALHAVRHQVLPPDDVRAA
jgi:CheY-like chemotaxis protein